MDTFITIVCYGNNEESKDSVLKDIFTIWSKDMKKQSLD